MTDEVERRDVLICNERGLHARASARFCDVARGFQSAITVTKGGMSVGGCSLMALLMLGAGNGTTIDLKATGPDAEAAIEALVALIGDRFGEAS